MKEEPINNEQNANTRRGPSAGRYRYRRPALRLGGLWEKRNGSGELYLEGDLGPTLRLVVRPNNSKTPGTNEPDFELFLNKKLPR